MVEQSKPAREYSYHSGPPQTWRHHQQQQQQQQLQPNQQQQPQFLQHQQHQQQQRQQLPRSPFTSRNQCQLANRRRRRPRTTDEVIQATDVDAADARISAVRNGYLDDPFATVLAGELTEVEGGGKGERVSGTAVGGRIEKGGLEKGMGAVDGDIGGGGYFTKTGAPTLHYPQQYHYHRQMQQQQQHKQQQQQRLPITNRGTYVRIKAIDKLVSQFLRVDSPPASPSHPSTASIPHKLKTRQIISLGAGSDSRYFRLVAENPGLDVVYHEIDFEANTSVKAQAIAKHPGVMKLLRDHLRRAGRLERQDGSTAEEAEKQAATAELCKLELPSSPFEDLDSTFTAGTRPDSDLDKGVRENESNGDNANNNAEGVSDKSTGAEARDVDKEIICSPSQILSPRYNLHALDLRDLISDKFTSQSLPNVLPHAPTLIVSECCLCYLSQSEGSDILKAITTKLVSPATPVGLVLYEAILPSDPFGQQMMANLESRRISFRTITSYPDLSSQRARLAVEGFKTIQGGSDVLFLWDHWIGEIEQERIKGLEMVDELEEWMLLAQHYCVVWGARDDSDASLDGNNASELFPGQSGGQGGVFQRAWGDLLGQVGDRKTHPNGLSDR